MKKRIFISLTMLLSVLHIVAQADIVEGEYFWDIDPGVGNATSFSVGTPGTDLNFDFSPSTNGLSNGNHLLGFRTKNADGVWGETFTKPIHVHHFTGLEYFFDTDPGVGNATQAIFDSNLSTFTGNVELSSSVTSPGPHTMGVRVKGIGEKWGTTHYSHVWVEDYSDQGEYFWDTDPGVGNGTGFNLSNTSSSYSGDVQFSSVGLTSGYHNLYIRMRAASGQWGHPKRKTIWVADNIVGGEYFWDTDPGVGNGFPIPVYI
ncbi:MAG: hypothetical protein JNM00_00565, partial [Flavobacteriales bacterium]|nr:hypothetical protein [Flavobacteriales bacterium]